MEMRIWIWDTDIDIDGDMNTDGGMDTELK